MFMHWLVGVANSGLNTWNSDVCERVVEVGDGLVWN